MVQTTRKDHYINNPGSFSIKALFLKTVHEYFKNWLQVMKESGVEIKASWHNTSMEHFNGTLIIYGTTDPRVKTQYFLTN